MLDVSQLRKVYGPDPNAPPAVADLSFTVAEQEFVCILGSSGCGKSTMLRCLSGLDSPTAGEVRLRDRRVTKPPEEMAFVFQDYSRSLLPWMKVRRNVSFPLRYKGVGNRAADDATEEALDAVGLAGKGDLYPWQLSGGMQQRVAIARALAYKPRVLLMDEPFASVDAQTRTGLEDLLLDVWQRYEITVLFVTHDIDEAIYLADRVLVLRAPAQIRHSTTVPLARPRDQLTTKQQPEFGQLRAELFNALDAQPAPA
ncbi:NitT/TauT family transport system ATP-binding protein [Tamaricihabitans halophyticus]|uniref:NitT/TauT family transport system ATP-binding protein n=1 Tax=Tamaricihabitans halophyticus TaxID=1262583 RepID=A0A4R2RCQ2_9PSEU|nr:ABC transporter ATP-binding protein [Tamaricihabitans halophyticus]TCP57205.1 NitT/TauT family transport system ATP-binding protein [Tamaricihabitans halophyticus]